MNIYFKDYDENNFHFVGDRKKHAVFINKKGGKWSSTIEPPGWVVNNYYKDEIKEYIKKIELKNKKLEKKKEKKCSVQVAPLPVSVSLPSVHVSPPAKSSGKLPGKSLSSGPPVLKKIKKNYNTKNNVENTSFVPKIIDADNISVVGYIETKNTNTHSGGLENVIDTLIITPDTITQRVTPDMDTRSVRADNMDNRSVRADMENRSVRADMDNRSVQTEIMDNKSYKSKSFKKYDTKSEQSEIMDNKSYKSKSLKNYDTRSEQSEIMDNKSYKSKSFKNYDTRSDSERCESDYKSKSFKNDDTRSEKSENSETDYKRKKFDNAMHVEKHDRCKLCNRKNKTKVYKSPVKQFKNFVKTPPVKKYTQAKEIKKIYKSPGVFKSPNVFSYYNNNPVTKKTLYNSLYNYKKGMNFSESETDPDTDEDSDY